MAKKADSGFDPGRVKTKSDLVVMLSGGQISAFFCPERDHDPKRTFQLFSSHPPWCIFVGADLTPNDLDVTAQIIQLVGKG